MKENIREKISNYNLKSTRGITLVALVVTIIVLLILAGVSLSAVFSERGIFSRAEKATDKYGQSKARETLELVLGEAQMQKYEQGLTDEQLDNKINEIGELLPKEKPDHPELQNVIVDGHIFEIDRSVPKIVDYIGPADGVVITATINGLSNGWMKPGDTANISITGTIKTYSGGNITNSTATSNGTPITTFPTNGGNYTISNITSDTTIVINAKDSNNKENSRTIPITIKVDGTAPILSNAKAEPGSLMKMKISVTATDTESGVAQINYTVEPNTVDITTLAEGTLQSGEEKEIITTAEGEYTVTFTATDNAGNTSAPITAKATTIDGMTVAEVKNTVNASNIADYIGKKVIDYETGAIWRVFYYDTEDADHPKGYFGDGDGTGPRAGTVYLKRDYDSTKTVNLYGYSSTTPSAEAVNYMKQLNPLWREAANGKKEVLNYLNNERMSASFYEQSIYGSYKNNTYSTYAVGAAPIEMWCKAQNIYKGKYDTSARTIGCGIKNANGYGYTINGGSLVDTQSTTVVTTSIEQSKVIATGSNQWLASPSSGNSYNECYVDSNDVGNASYAHTDAFCPVVPLNR